MRGLAPTLARRLAHALGRAALVFAVLAVGLGVAAAQGPTWASLTTKQQTALAPLQRDWPTLDETQRRKWMEVAGRFDRMPEAERLRVRERMAQWVRMSPAERRQARVQFNEVRQVPDDERRAKWEVYQSLPEAERRRLAERDRTTGRSTDAAATRRPQPTDGVRSAPAANPARQVARPGATTTPLTEPAHPPFHHRPGLPKIAVTPGFVDPATLLPRRGPQGAAAQAAAPASASGRSEPAR